MNPALKRSSERPERYRLQLPLQIISNLTELTIWVDKPDCVKALERIEQAVRREYTFTYPQNNKEKSDRIFQDVQDILNSPTLSDSCRATANQVYAMVAPLGLPNPIEGSYIFLETMNLFQLDLLRPLTKQIRNELGGEWIKKNKKRSDQYQIMGAYDCLQSIVWFDPSQRPFDLAASLAHEIEHFYQDKITHWEDSDDFSPERVADTLNIDESLATLHSSFAQFIHDRKFNRSFYRKNGEARKHPPKKLSRYFSLDSDSTLYSQNGVLNALWRSQIKLIDEAVYTSHLLLLRALSELPASESIAWDRVRLGTPYFEKLPASFQALYELSEKIKGAYFQGRSSSPRSVLERIQRDFERRPLLVMPLAGLSIAHQKFSPLEIQLITEVMGVSTFEKIRAEKQILPRPMTLYIERSFQASQGCIAFTRLAKSGQLDDYLGARLGGTQPGGDGVRPGGDGVRPGGDGVRPGGDGVRPGGDGVRPGGDGVRPGGDGVRPSTQTYPCLHPDTWGGI